VESELENKKYSGDEQPVKTAKRLVILTNRFTD
jgi:hypothetical protein